MGKTLLITLINYNMGLVTKVSGIDIASEKFDVCFMIQDLDGRLIIKGTRSFKNTPVGFERYWDWFNKRGSANDVLHVMEATGVYHEELCYYLHSRGGLISVQLAQKVKYFAKSLNLKTKTDKVDAKMIARMGFNGLELWKPISEKFKSIRDLSRTLVKLQKSKSITVSQLHAIKKAHNSLPQTIEVFEELNIKYESLIQKCEQEILKLLSLDKELKKRIDRITAIKGIGVLTVVKLIAETDGFRNCSSIKKITSYAGLDVSQKQSGKQLGSSRISKKGNPYIRAALYMPTLCAVRYDDNFKRFYNRLIERMPKKKQAIVASMRKMLILIYTLWKNEEEYEINHTWK